MVYFIKSGRFVKIGFSHDPWRRLYSLKSSNPHPMELLGAIEGTRFEESRLHKHFRHQQHHGEWFRLRGDLKAFIAAEAQPVPPSDVAWLNVGRRAA